MTTHYVPFHAPQPNQLDFFWFPPHTRLSEPIWRTALVFYEYADSTQMADLMMMMMISMMTNDDNDDDRCMLKNNDRNLTLRLMHALLIA